MNTFGECMTLRNRINTGDILLKELTEVFDTIISNSEAIKEDISKTHTVKKLNDYFYNRHGGEKKAQLVKRVFDDIVIQSFNLLDVHLTWMCFSEKAPKIEDVVRDSLKDMKQTDIEAHAAKVKKRVEERKQRNKEVLKALTDPKTYDEFIYWHRSKQPNDKLTPEQALLWDTLQADKKLEQEKAKSERHALVEAPELNTSAEIVKTVHSLKGHDLYVVVLADHVGKEAFRDLCGKAKRLDGYYSRYSKDGAVPGFQFTGNEDAESFLGLISGEDQSNSDKQLERTQTAEEKASSRLLEMAEKMEATGNDSLNADRQTNTAKRAREAGYAEETARKTIQLAATIRKLAEGIKTGVVKYLTKIRYKTDIELLNGLLNQSMYTRIRNENVGYGKEDKTVRYSDIAFATFPEITVNRSDAHRLISDLDDCNGGSMLSKRVAKAFRDNKGDVLTFLMRNDSLMQKVVSKLKQNPEVGYCLGLVERVTTIDHLNRLGIETSAELRTALREFFPFVGDKPVVDKVKEMERELVGLKIDGFFPTPPDVIELMIEKITVGTREGLNQNDKVLEPSAGKGDIATALAELYPEVSVIECNCRLREILEEKGLDIVDRDFLQHTERYDKIVMNPPFEKGQDIEHVMHAYNLLESGGRLVAIMAGGATWSSDKKKFVEFREWLSDKGDSEQLPEGSFKSAFRPTGVNTRIVTIDK